MDGYDVVVIGSGFGGSAAALRLTEKGYRVLVLEKGGEWPPGRFPASNWRLPQYVWWPQVGWRGFFKLTFFRHVSIMSGVGVGGGSLVYAGTHPEPHDAFYETGSWAGLADWKAELAPHFAEARRMLGVTTTPTMTPTDHVLRDVAIARQRAEAFRPSQVAIYFGRPGETVPDPYFGGRGPDRTGCIQCGGCLVGCRYGAKNSLDRNYLWLARRLGAELQPDTEVTAVRPRAEGGYCIEARQGAGVRRTRVSYAAPQVVFAGGVLGTVDLLLRMKADPSGLPRLSDRLGRGVRTNSEAIVGIVSRRADRDLSKGVAIGSIYEIDETSHVEPVRYPAGSGMMRLLAAPHVSGRGAVERVLRLVATIVTRPVAVAQALFVRDFARQSTLLLFMRAADGALRLRRTWFGLTTAQDDGPAPSASMPEATALANDVAARLDGFPVSMVTETLFDIPSTAHVLGGCVIGSSAEHGVIDRHHRVFGYDGLYVMDGSAVSANPGANPSLTILAMAERALAALPPVATRSAASPRAQTS
jgi:cholesterol oxidase